MSIVASILGTWATLYGLYYKTYERSLLQGLYVTLVRRINVSAQTVEKCAARKSKIVD